MKTAIFIPKRNIETWIHHLQGESVIEEGENEKLCVLCVSVV
jgi:hypothetical protein